MLKLSHDLNIADLYQRQGLARLDGIFLKRLGEDDNALHARLLAARAAPESCPAADESALMIALGPRLDAFVAELFDIGTEAAALSQQHADLTPLYEVKRLFVQRQAAKMIRPEQAAQIDGPALYASLVERLGGEFHGFDDLGFARQIVAWQADKEANAEILETARQYAAWAVHTPQGRERHRHGVLFKTPTGVDPGNLVPAAQVSEAEGVTSFRIQPEHIRRRRGFALTDQGTDLTGALDQSNYCILCHTQKKDSCSRGLREKPAPDAPEKITYKKSPFGVPLAGCPLAEKISEFHTLKNLGHSISALAVITVDNPMAAGTGHRICNDCMKSCIYQRQEPVNIPEVETRTLKDVLELPWGFEIYSLLTRWNPLNIRRPIPLPPTGKKVLVAGMGPAGFTLAHHLINDGHSVVGIDGLKIEPLPESIGGVRIDGGRTPFEAIRDVTTLYEPLDDRVMAGFGGVAEYGITVRWNKNFLKILRLLLVRRAEFALFGGVRFGGTLTVDDALARGFDHIALCLGAGKPTVLDIPNGLARGVRTASDFLMALQLTGAAKQDSLANMQLRLPVVVVGGGLTAIDTATESLAYYPVQVEKFLQRYEALAASIGEDAIRARWDDLDREIAEEFLAHARAIRDERAAAQHEQRPARVIELLRTWGGATIAYRRRMIDSPSYTLNHEEIEKALEEGITFAECLSPLAIDVDNHGAALGMRFAKQQFGDDGRWEGGGEHWLPAHTIFVAAGTQPNTVLAREDTAHFQLDGKFFRACDESGAPVKPDRGNCKPDHPEVLLSRFDDGRYLSFFGDLHPSYSGNVVKAMASAKQGYPLVSRVLARQTPQSTASNAAFFDQLAHDLLATIHKVERLTPTIVEVVIKAPLAARNFQPGQFYRLQNFETLAAVAAGTRMQMEGIALTGAWVDREQGLVSTIVLEMGGSANLCAALQPGEPVILMGPTGMATHIQADETVILCGGGLGNAVLFSIGQAFRARNSKVLYFAGYKKVIDRYKVQDIEAAADIVIWCCDEEPGFEPGRPQDRTFVGNIVQAMEAYASGRLGPQTIRTEDAERIIAIGSDRMMAGVGKARHDVLKSYLKPHHFAIGSINSPMQCMMKEICAQCLQLHRDPTTGEVTHVFSCFNQDQPLDSVDFHLLNERLKQNSLQEKLSAQWLGYCLNELRQRRATV
ncbi:MAG: pyridine nucleotide-disulfide oxidoreductase [Sterolibacterium sp.]|jgi:NADPH-dependent glutamate synthase beta subunit-like oxidoreductase/NAD(P)H-flavin reductase